MRSLLTVALLALLAQPGAADYGGSRGTYLKFELEKVSIVSIEFRGLGVPVRSKVLRVSGLPARLQSDQRRTGRLSSRNPGALTATLTGKRQHRPVKILKPVDKVTPLLKDAFARNQVLQQVVLHGRHRQTGRPVRIVLQGVKIQAQKLQGAGRPSPAQGSSSSTGSFQTEMVSLSLRG